MVGRASERRCTNSGSMSSLRYTGTITERPRSRTDEVAGSAFGREEVTVMELSARHRSDAGDDGQKSSDFLDRYLFVQEVKRSERDERISQADEKRVASGKLLRC